MDTVGITTAKLKSEPMRLEKAIAMCNQKLGLLRQTLQTNSNKALQDELADVQKLTSGLQQASVDASAYCCRFAFVPSFPF